jgi:hypothetical protein
MFGTKNQGRFGQRQLSATKQRSSVFLRRTDATEIKAWKLQQADEHALMTEALLECPSIVLYGDHVRFVMSLKMW